MRPPPPPVPAVPPVAAPAVPPELAPAVVAEPDAPGMPPVPAVAEEPATGAPAEPAPEPAWPGVPAVPAWALEPPAGGLESSGALTLQATTPHPPARTNNKAELLRSQANESARMSGVCDTTKAFAITTMKIYFATIELPR